MFRELLVRSVLAKYLRNLDDNLRLLTEVTEQKRLFS